jgi:Uma2 family endonuclease
MGEYDHARLQLAIGSYLYQHRKDLGITVVNDQRVQVGKTRFRVPDICVTLEPPQQIFTLPPFLCIEILSPEDRLAAMQDRAADYLTMGVPYVFVIDPKTRKTYRWTTDGMHQVAELRTENPTIVIPLADLFEE